MNRSDGYIVVKKLELVCGIGYVIEWCWVIVGDWLLVW